MLAVILIVGIVVAGYVVYSLVAARRSRWIKIIDDEGEHHRIPLPPHSVPGENIGKANVYFTTATTAELKSYFHLSLWDAGWVIGDIFRVSAGNSVVLHRGDKRLYILMESDINILRGRMREKLTFTMEVNVKSSPIEQELIAIRRLGKAGNRDAIKALIELLSDQRAEIRIEAISALNIIKDERSLQPLISKLKDKVTEVRQHAATALGEFASKQAVCALIIGLNNKDSNFKAICAWSLGKIKDNRAVTALIAALESPDWKLKTNAAIALAEIGDRSEVEPLIARLKNTKNDSTDRAIAFMILKGLLGWYEIDTMLREMSTNPDQHPFVDQLKNAVAKQKKLSTQSDQHLLEDQLTDAVAENVADFVTDTIFDILGIKH